MARQWVDTHLGTTHQPVSAHVLLVLFLLLVRCATAIAAAHHTDHRRRVIDEFDGVVSHLDGAWQQLAVANAQSAAQTACGVC